MDEMVQARAAMERVGIVRELPVVDRVDNDGFVFRYDRAVVTLTRAEAEAFCTRLRRVLYMDEE